MEQRLVTSCYCLQTRQAAAAIKNYYDKILSASGITLRQYSLLLSLAELGSCSIRKIADATQLERSTLARGIKPLIKSGHVIDLKELHARNSRLALTPKGQEALAMARQLWAQAQQNIEERFGQEGMQHLHAALALLKQL